MQHSEDNVRLISAKKPMQSNENQTVKLTLDLKNPPPLAAAQSARLDAVAAVPDKNIDYTDAPYLPDAAWVKVTERAHTK